MLAGDRLCGVAECPSSSDAAVAVDSGRRRATRRLTRCIKGAMMAHMTRGKAAAALASFAVGLLGFALAYGAFVAVGGAYLVVVAPASGSAIAVGVWTSLRRLCTTGSRHAERAALGGIILLVATAVLGISFGGALLLLPAAILALAAALTPRPRARTVC
jgi:hypothetical protein